MLNFADELNPEVTGNTGEGDSDTVGAAIAAYEAMNDVEMAMIKVDMLEKGAVILANGISANDALVAKGYESEGGVSPVTTGYEAVCVMLGVDGNTVAGYESSDDKKAEGLLTKIWGAIKTAAAAVWKVITDMFSKVSNFILSLIGKGDDTAKKLANILTKDKIYVRQLTESEIKSMAGKLSTAYTISGKGINYDNANTMVEFQKKLMKQVLTSDLNKSFAEFESDIKALASLKDGVTGKEGGLKDKLSIDLTNAIGKLVASVKDMVIPDTSTTLVNELNTDEPKRFIDAKAEVAKPINGYVAGDVSVLITAVTKNGINILVSCLHTNGKEAKVVTKQISTDNDKDILNDVIKNSASSKTLSKEEIDELTKSYEIAGAIAKDVINGINVKKLKVTAMSILDIAEKTLGERLVLTNENKLSMPIYNIYKNAFNSAKEIVNKTIPAIVTGVIKTAHDVVNSNVVDYAKLSLTEEKK